jgi:predicted Zn-ribbon and HTH transcriptional regulator
MEREKIIKILTDVENKSNKDLFEVQEILYTEHEKTKNLIIDLTRHLEIIENSYDKVDKELKKRISK